MDNLFSILLAFCKNDQLVVTSIILTKLFQVVCDVVTFCSQSKKTTKSYHVEKSFQKYLLPLYAKYCVFFYVRELSLHFIYYLHPIIQVLQFFLY